MATTKKKKEVKATKKRLIISYEKLPEEDKERFEELYCDNLMDHIQTVTRPDGTPMFVAPLETEENIYMVKIDLRVDSKMNDEDFDKDDIPEEKSDHDDITNLINSENGKGTKEFHLNHGDYSSINSLEEAAAKEDMKSVNFTSLDDMDVDVVDESTLDL